MAQSSLPPGFRFHPTDIELVSYYLKRKVMGKPYRFQAISEIELYKFAPWDLPDKSCLKSKDLEWYFFCPRDRKYANGSRTNRATDIGYWKTTGKDRHITYNFRTVGMKRTLIFHIGKAPRGDRTDWVMHEYRLEDKELDNTRISQDAYVLCKIFQKSGPGPKNGEQYGAPFKEEDWEDDEAFDNPVSFPLVSSPTPEPLNDQSIMLVPVHLFESSEIGEVSSMPDPLDADGIFLEQLDEILNSSPLHSGNANDEIHRYLDEIFSVDTEGIYNGLEDLSGQTELEPTDCISLFNDLDNKYPLQPMIPEHDHDQYLELNDLHFIGKSDPEHDHDQYLELNDLHFIGKSDPLLVPDDMFVHDSFAHFPIDNTNFYIDTALTTESVLRDPLPKGPDIFTNHFHFFPKMNAFESTQRSNALVCEPDDSCSVDLFQGLAGGSDSVPSTNNTNGSCS